MSILGCVRCARERQLERDERGLFFVAQPFGFFISGGRLMTRPVGITGAQISNHVGFSVGWLNFSLPLSLEEANIYTLELGIDLTKAEILNIPYRRFENSGVVGKIRFGFDPDRVHVSVPASHLETLNWSQIRDGLAFINGVEGRRFSRIDLTVDDKNRVTSLEDIQNALEDGNIVTRFKQIDPRVKIVPRVSKDTTGITFGARKSDTYLRVYDKYLESKFRDKKAVKSSDNDFLRWELELKNERADSAIQCLIALDSHQAVWTLGLIRAAVDFRVIDNDNVTRCTTLLDWWQHFLDAAEKVILPIAKVTDSYEKVKDWVFRAVAPLLAVVAARDGEDFLADIAKYGKDRWKARHLKLIE